MSETRAGASSPGPGIALARGVRSAVTRESRDRRVGEAAGRAASRQKGAPMRGQVALVREQGQNFAVLVVKDRVIRNSTDRDDAIAWGEREFGVRTALIGESGSTWGPNDIVRWLEGVPVEALPWREYTIEN
jgi:hypothetical protein